MKKVQGLLAFALLLALLAPVKAQNLPEGNTDLQDRIKKLEAETQALKLELMNLRQELAQIRTKLPSANPDTNEVIYKSMKLIGLTAKGGPYKPGDTVTFHYALKNTSDQELQLPPNQKFPLGARQHWIERLGEDPKIQSIPAKVARKGHLYAAGGYSIPGKGKIPPAGVIPFASSIDTNGFPAGRYKYYVEYRDSKGKTFQLESVEFELLEK